MVMSLVNRASVTHGKRDGFLFYSFLVIFILQYSILVSAAPSWRATSCEQQGLLDAPCGSGFKAVGECCQKCTTCQPGYGVDPNSNNYCLLECIPCQEGLTFNSEHQAAICTPCANCDLQFRKTARTCSLTQNTVCEVCLDGYYEITGWYNIPEPVCQKCTSPDDHPDCQLFFERLRTKVATTTPAKLMKINLSDEVKSATNLEATTEPNERVFLQTMTRRTVEESISFTTKSSDATSIATITSVLTLGCLVLGIVAAILIYRRLKKTQIALRNGLNSASASTLGTTSTDSGSINKIQGSQVISSPKFAVLECGEVKNTEIPWIPVKGLAQSMGYPNLKSASDPTQQQEEQTAPLLDSLKLPFRSHDNNCNHGNISRCQPYEDECNCCISNSTICNRKQICQRCHKFTNVCMCGVKPMNYNVPQDKSPESSSMELTVRKESRENMDVSLTMSSVGSLEAQKVEQKDISMLGFSNQEAKFHTPAEVMRSLTDNSQTGSPRLYPQCVLNMDIYKNALEIAKEIKTEDWCYDCQELLGRYLDPDNTSPACGKNWIHFGLGCGVGLTHRDLQNMRDSKPYCKTLAVLHKMATLNKCVDVVLRTLKDLERFDALHKLCFLFLDEENHNHGSK